MKQVNPISNADTSLYELHASEQEIAAALAYERIFVPALFQAWPIHVIEAVNFNAGDRVLDIACGTGVLTREFMRLAGSSPPPIGLDINSGMLAVARQLQPDIRWEQGDAQALPYAPASFDCVVSQFGLMFFPDRVGAIREMARVLDCGGRVALAVWDALENNPGFAEKVAVLDEIAGTEAGDALRAPFCLGDAQALRQLGVAAGLSNIGVETISGHARFESVHAFVEAEVRGWLPVMDVHLSESTIRSIHSTCENVLSGYVEPGTGEIIIPTSAHILSADGTDQDKSGEY